MGKKELCCCCNRVRGDRNKLSEVKSLQVANDLKGYKPHASITVGSMVCVDCRIKAKKQAKLQAGELDIIFFI